MQLSPHFTLIEFTRSATADRLGIDNTPSEEHLENLRALAERLESVRALLGCPIIITSGYRCAKLNAAVDGSRTSSHVQGQAADFHAPGFGTDMEVADAITNSDAIQFDQIIFEQARTHWVHFGIGDRMRREVLSWRAGRGFRNGIVRM